MKVGDCQNLAVTRLAEIKKQRVQLIEQAIERKMTEKKMFSKKFKYPTKELAIAALKDSKGYQGWWDNEYEALCNYKKQTESDLERVLTMLNKHNDRDIEIDEATFYLLRFNHGN